MDTREKLLAAAARLFHEKGFTATSVAEILERADVNSGSLYHFFSGKEELLRGVLERYHALLPDELIAPAEATTEDGVERVFALLALYRKGMEITGCRYGCPIGNLALETTDAYPNIRPLVEANFVQWIGHVERWLAAEGARFPRGTDFHRLAQLVLTIMEGGLMQTRARRSLAPFDESVAALRHYLDLLMGKKGKGNAPSRTTHRRPSAPRRNSRSARGR